MSLIAIALLMQVQAQQPGRGCETVGTELFCPPSDASDPFFGAMAEGSFRRRVDAARQALAAKEQAPLELHKRVGALIANRDCDGAYKLALTEGDLDLATQAQRLCPGTATTP